MTPFDLCSVKLDSTPTSIEFSPNSERIAIGTIRGKVIVYDMVGKKMTIQRQVQGSTDCSYRDDISSWVYIGVSGEPFERITQMQFHALLLTTLKEYWPLHLGTSLSGQSGFRRLDRTTHYLSVCLPRK